MNTARAIALVPVLLLGVLATAAAPVPAQNLTLKRVMLSAGGVGYFEYESRITGDAVLELSVRLDQVDDVMKSIVVYDDRGVAYAMAAKHDRAVADFTKAIEINPRDALAYSLRGTTYRDKGIYERAIADYTKAIYLDGRFAEAYVGRATVYYKKGDYDQAWASIRRAQSLGLQVPPEFLVALRKASGTD